jgi:hypothetical protein
MVVDILRPVEMTKRVIHVSEWAHQKLGERVKWRQPVWQSLDDVIEKAEAWERSEKK